MLPSRIIPFHIVTWGIFYFSFNRIICIFVEGCNKRYIIEIKFNKVYIIELRLNKSITCLKTNKYPDHVISNPFYNTKLQGPDQNLKLILIIDLFFQIYQ